MKSVTLFLFITLLGCFSVAKAQVVEQKQPLPQQQNENVNPKLKERALRAKAARRNVLAVQPNQGVQNNSKGINEDDPYQGRSKEFLDLMVVDKLPADFPIYKKGTGIRYYNDIVEGYFRKHLDLLKEQPKKKLSHL